MGGGEVSDASPAKNGESRLRPFGPNRGHVVTSVGKVKIVGRV